MIHAATDSRPADPVPQGRCAARPLIRLEWVGKTYSKGTVAVKGVDLTVGEHEFLSLLGPSGCGQVDGPQDDRRSGRRDHRHRSTGPRPITTRPAVRRATWASCSRSRR